MKKIGEVYIYEKIVSLIMCICIIVGSFTLPSLAISASATIETFDLNIITKDMITEEIEHKTLIYQPQPRMLVDGEVGERSQGWIPPSLMDTENAVMPACVGTTDCPCFDGVIGNDDREIVSNTKAYPYSAICYIESVWPDGSTSAGTAWMCGSNYAVTAGHMIYDMETHSFASEITVWPGKKGDGWFDNPFGKAEKISVLADAYVQNNGTIDYDWGMIKLDEDIGEETGWFGYSWIQNDVDTCVLTVCGYPADHSFHQLKCSGVISSKTATRLSFYMDAVDGQSGSPVYTADACVYGIYSATTNNNQYTAETNHAARITAEVYYYLSHGF